MALEMKRRPDGRQKRCIGEVAKSAVLISLSCPDAQRSYRHAIDEFVDWYSSEPRFSLNLRFEAVRRLAYEASECGLLRSDLAAGTRPFKGVKKLGVRLGNWLTPEQGQALWQAPGAACMRPPPPRARSWI